jgi:hypothetical protein
MSTLTAALIVVVLLAAGLLLLALGLCRAAGRSYPAKETHGQRAWDFTTEDWVDFPAGTKPGPDQMTGPQIADADDLDLLYRSRPFDPATDPQWAAGRARLLDAIRDEQKGDQA